MVSSRPTAALVATFALGVGRPAHAQADPEATRQALIQEAAAASQDGDHTRAIACARRAAELRPSPSLQFFLAREELAVGLPLEAYGHAEACVNSARAAAELAGRDTLLQRCEALQREAARPLARLTLRAPSPRPAGLRITVDALPFDLAALDLHHMRLPGTVAVTATAEGFTPFHTSRTLDVGADVTLTIQLTPAQTPRAVLETAPPPASSPSLVGPVALAGSAAAGFVVFGVLGGLALDAQRARDAACPSSGACDLAEASLADGRYRDRALGANVAVGVAGGLAAAALTWWLVQRFSQRSARTAVTPAAFTLRW